MARNIVYSYQHQALKEIHNHYEVLEKALKLYFSTNHNSIPKPVLRQRLLEIKITSAFSILSAIAAAFCLDFLQRIRRKKKDAISKKFQHLYKQHKRLSIEKILDVWKEETNIPRHYIGKIKAVFNYRNWIAHGRYWEIDSKREYEYQELYELAQTIFDSFPFEMV